MKSWPLTADEERALRAHLNKNIDLEALITKHSKHVEGTLGVQSTHKAICPNKEHKGGEERTPSFFFSTETNTYNCFGCQVYGDAFDFISLVTGQPVHIVLDEYKRKGPSFSDIKAPARPKFKVRDVGYKLGISFREYLKALEGAPLHSAEAEWVDSMFRRIDDRFSCLEADDYEQALSFAMQMNMELERRQECY